MVNFALFRIWMRDNDLIRQKAEDLYEVYLRGIETMTFSSLRDAAEWVVFQPARRFYIEARTASLLVTRYHDGNFMTGMHPASIRMIMRLYNLLQGHFIANPGDNRPVLHIMEELVEQPAPEFYITPEAARKILRKAIAQRRSQWGSAG